MGVEMAPYKICLKFDYKKMFTYCNKKKFDNNL